MLKQNKIMTWAGWGLTLLVSAALTFSAVMKFQQPPEMIKEVEGKLGVPQDVLLGIGFTELACVLVFLFPRTAMLGAVLLTGYLGGAVATHVRVHDNILSPVIVGVLVWLALFLRDARVRALLPIHFPHHDIQAKV